MKALRAAIGAVFGAMIGAWLATTHLGAFVTPDTLDPRRWTVIVPGMDMNVTQHAGRGTKVVGGAIVLTPHVFARADIVTPRDTRAVGEVVLALAPDSGPLFVRLRDPSRMWAARVTPGRVEAEGHVYPFGDTLTLRVVDGAVHVGETAVGPIGAATLEISAESSTVRITRIRVADAAGATVVEEDPARDQVGPALPGAGIGAVAGAAAGFAGPGGAVALLFPLAVLFTPPDAWLAWVERLYLVRWAPYDLARALLLVSFLPLLVTTLAAAGIAMPGAARGGASLRRDVWGPWGLIVLAAAGLASRGGGVDLWLAIPGVAFLLAPLLLARQGFAPVGLLLRDLPALFALALLGWGAGALPAIVWRLVILTAGAGVLLRRAPRLAADGLFVLAIAALPAAELAARATWLDTAWDAARLGATGPVTPFWEGTCGADPKTVVYLGGSSTGGAYQLLGEPGAFFPARVHEQLCASRAVRTVNLGGSGRDTWTFSRQPDVIRAYAPSVLVGYFGVNDLLTQDNPLTRAQREALEAEQGAAARGMAALAARSRLVTGLSLLLRPATDLAAPTVPDVPLPDAEVNLRTLIGVARSLGAAVVLVLEHAEPETAAKIAAYGAMEARLAEELDGVRFVDPGPVLGAEPGALVDRNHLSRAGAARLAELLTPVVAEGLGNETTPR